MISRSGFGHSNCNTPFYKSCWAHRTQHYLTKIIIKAPLRTPVLGGVWAGKHGTAVEDSEAAALFGFSALFQSRKTPHCPHFLQTPFTGQPGPAVRQGVEEGKQDSSKSSTTLQQPAGALRGEPGLLHLQRPDSSPGGPAVGPVFPGNYFNPLCLSEQLRPSAPRVQA